jgi:hypothetical protein
MEQTDERLARVRAEIAAGTYAPTPDAVAEALLGWIARPEQFEARRGARRSRSGLDVDRSALQTGDDADDGS